VAQAESLRQKFHFSQARELLTQAPELLGPVGPEELRRQAGLALGDLDLAEKRDAARLRAATLVEGRIAPDASSRSLRRPSPRQASADRKTIAMLWRRGCATPAYARI
jgi:hypothetical protein